eukprot:scaffold8908_cov51-Cyclotella_meneghiniana.AAC.1
MSCSDESVGNASIASEECFDVEEKPQFNYRGPKVLPTKNETPVTICTTNTIGMVKSRRLFRVLLDSGATCSLIKRSCLPKNCQTKAISSSKKVSTLAGKIKSQEVVTLRDLRLPEFDKNRRINQQKCLVFDNDNCNYDIILGTNFLSKTGIKLDFETHEMKWFDTVLPLRPKGGLEAKDFDAMADAFHIQVEEELFGEDWLQCFATAILDAKYEFVSVSQVIDNLTHLNMHQKADLLQVLKDNQSMFDGTLGVYPHKKFHIDIDENAKPVHARPYPYYTFELDEESQDLCTIVTPFGKYKYLRLPMGLKCSPDIAQSVMENVLRGIEDIDVYIDDIGAFSLDWKQHVELLGTVLRRIRENGFTINPLKCEWAVKETDWLGYWLTPRGLKPWKKKIDAILHMDRPRTPKELRRFIGCVNYYRDMWPSRAHVLKPLTDKAGLKKGEKLNWTDEMQTAFDKMRLLLAADALAAYPDHNK